MTEAEWLTTREPELMLGYIFFSKSDYFSERKHQLYIEAVACGEQSAADEWDYRDGPMPFFSHAGISNRIRDIFGNPFRPITFNRSWLTPTVTGLAQAVYDERQLPSGLFDNQRMGVLADALEEAGCDNRDILDHLRNGGDHVRGCWTVDVVLGKE